MNLENIRKSFPNAHPDLKVVIVKRNEKKNFKKKKEKEVVPRSALHPVQEKQAPGQLH